MTLHIRDIQHYMYCPRRFALLSINRDWSENAFVVKADLMHENVHDGSHSFSNQRKIVRSAVSVYNDFAEYDIFGVLDCVEFVKDKNGVKIPGLNGTYRVVLVEYKPKAPKDQPFHETDAIQVFAQKLCADFVWHCDSEAYLYYNDIRKRIKLPFDSEFERYDQQIKEALVQMRSILEAGEIPKRKRGQKCSGCSIKDTCFPKNKGYTIRDMILSLKEEDGL